MKKYIFIFCAVLAIISLTAFGMKRRNDSENVSIGKPLVELNLTIDSRHGTTITKEKLQRAMSVADILPKQADWSTYPIQSLMVTTYKDNEEQTAIGKSLNLNPAQISLLQTLNYSDYFSLKAPCKGKHVDVPDREVFDLTYFLTVAPEKEAENSLGKDVLIDYLKANSELATIIIKQEHLERGNVMFTITKKGNISNVHLSSSSGYNSLDELMLNLIKTLPGTWTPAMNSTGEKVEQEFAFSFGRGGC